MLPALELLGNRRLVVLTGAGLSTDSGIPDYRGPGSVARQPMTFQEFVASARAQQRYWARSHLGWSRIGTAHPNDGHRAVAQLGADLVITQNVDGLHEAVGTHPLVALHGRVSEVVCLGCGTLSPRSVMNERMTAANPGWLAAHAEVASRPDGDTDLEETADFVVPPCTVCGGVLKPHVVFFGENVPKPRVQQCFDAVDALGGSPTPPDHAPGALLVLGSSLTVMSGLRFVRRARRNGTPVVIVNRGQTRGDDLATVLVHEGTTEFSQALARERGARLTRP